MKDLGLLEKSSPKVLRYLSNYGETFQKETYLVTLDALVPSGGRSCVLKYRSDPNKSILNPIPNNQIEIWR